MGSGSTRISCVCNLTIRTGSNTGICYRRSCSLTSNISCISNTGLLNDLINVIDLVTTLALTWTSCIEIIWVFKNNIARRGRILLFCVLPLRLIVEPRRNCLCGKVLLSRLSFNWWVSQNIVFMIAVNNLTCIHNTLNKTVRDAIISNWYLINWLLI